MIELKEDDLKRMKDLIEDAADWMIGKEPKRLPPNFNPEWPSHREALTEDLDKRIRFLIGFLYAKIGEEFPQ